MIVKDNHAGYYPGGQEMTLKLVYDRKDGRVLGAQAFGGEGTEKRIDVVATALQGRLSLDDLAELDLAYAPPFSSAKDPVNQLGYMAENLLSGDCDVAAPAEVDQLAAQGWRVVDVRSAGEHERGAIPGTENLPLDELRAHLTALAGERVLVYCEVGQRGHTAAALLHDHGIRVRNLDGGYQTWRAATRAADATR